ncbi:MAG TPA: cyclic pyranopterin monophosphate synthase MoaC, partial [Actinomycetota bacterium]|nr:cyclic pyranopterin monophosphate synthase MoaC [Actinomycetota bacterium]
MDDRSRSDGTTRIVEVGAKPETAREATAEAWLVTTSETVGALVAGTTKGSPIETAKVAGMIGVKKTPDLLPHCHQIRVTGADIVVEPNVAEGRIHAITTVRAFDRTGVEMEALTA